MIIPNINSRIVFIDFIRGITIVLMIFFHFCFDLNMFNFIHVDIINGPFWYILPRIIVFLFLFTVGISLSLVHNSGIQWNKFFRRLVKIISLAICISVVTYFAFPQNWIYFGTLHAIALISFFSLPFIRRPHLAFILSLALFIPSIFFNYNLPFFEMQHSSFDYISPFPWIGASFLGIFAASRYFHLFKIPENSFVNKVSYMGQHSLLIYVVHQPILFTVVYIFHKIFHS